VTSALARAFVLGGKIQFAPVPIDVGEYEISWRSLRLRSRTSVAVLGTVHRASTRSCSRAPSGTHNDVLHESPLPLHTR
jgi:hypothetical protein